MGLYDLACIYSERSGHGLFLDTLFEDFHRFADESPVLFAVFIEIKNNFQIVFNSGFNAETVRKSVSGRDFWNGMLPEIGWQTVHGDSLGAFYQLFSRQDADFGNLCMKRSRENDLSYIFLAAGTYENSILDALLEKTLPLIRRLSLQKYLLIKKTPRFADFSAGIPPAVTLAADTFAAEQKPQLYVIRLNTLFESLNAYLCPSDFDCICDCLYTQLSADSGGICGMTQDKSLVYTVIAEEHEADFYAAVEKTVKKLFSPQRMLLIHTEKIVPPALRTRTAKENVS